MVNGIIGLVSLSESSLLVYKIATDKRKYKQMRLHQTKNFCTEKETINKMKSESIIWENTFANDASSERLISKIYKELLQLSTRKEGTAQFKKIGQGPEYTILQIGQTNDG